MVSREVISQTYVRRINRVIDFLREHSDRNVSLEEVAELSCFSKYHFHRIFSAVAGETLNNFATRIRLEKAARLLRFSNASLTAVALDCGFSSSSTFSRAFRSAYGMAPKSFRKSGSFENSKIGKDIFSGQTYVLPMTSRERTEAFPVHLMEMPAREVAYIRVRDAFNQDAVISATQHLIEWAHRQDIFSHGTLFGMTIDDPDVTPRHLYRYEICLTSREPFECATGISRLTLPAMRYAVIRVSGDIRMVATAWDYLIRQWLLSSAFEPEHAPALEIFLDKDCATDWSHFELELCLPVKKLED